MTEKAWAAADLLKTVTDFLGQKGLPSPRLEAEILLSEVLGLTRVELYVNFERVLTPEELEDYRGLVRRRLSHEPSAYILGRKEFYLLNFKVTPDVLIPRPETELLVDEARRLAAKFPAPRIADLGCGCGAIALALAKSLPQSQILATDVSPEALAVAKFNAEALKLDNQVEFRQGDLIEPLLGRSFDLVCANLPYVPHDEIATLEPDVQKFEPHLALDGGPDGLSLYRRLLPEVKKVLAPGGYLLMEIHPPTFSDLASLVETAGLGLAQAIPDLARANRLAVAQAPPTA
ncbi:MAG: peptide chain release factor N(5)-glutamine methyltransferase [Deltaproteobacteria bacterium]|jgi:release factor glutamine methyltransferase|nr:peptide chain release factor N(5)-glutamine methyltransferase [Deltaproteobacteria bacterium]